MARLAKGLETLRSQVNAAYPHRSTDSDGWIGDTSHAARPSDHNPGSRGIVHAIDITHDPKGGFNSYAFADLLLKNQDKRLSYIISNSRIGSGPGGPSPGKWRPYNGSNPHDHHCHISITKAGEDSSTPWNIGGVAPVSTEVAAAYVPPPPSVRLGDMGANVEKMQAALGCKITGVYKANTETEWALKLAQFRHGLIPDGVCGPMTWAVIAPKGKSV